MLGFVISTFSGRRVSRKILPLAEWLCRTTHSLSAHPLSSSAFSCTTHQVVFQILFSAQPLWVEYFACCERRTCMEAVQSNPWCAEKHVTVAAHVSQIFIHGTDTDSTLLFTRSSPLLLTLIAGLRPLQHVKMTTSGHFADTSGST